MTTTINAVSGTGLTQTSDGSGIVKLQSNGVTTNALAWVNFVGSNGTRNSSYNVSSVTRTGAGLYVVNFASPLSDANYSITVSKSLSVTVTNFTIWYESPTTTSVYVRSYENSAYHDPTSISVTIFGN